MLSVCFLRTTQLSSKLRWEGYTPSSKLKSLDVFAMGRMHLLPLLILSLLGLFQACPSFLHDYLLHCGAYKCKMHI